MDPRTSLTTPFDDPLVIFGLAMVVFLVAPLVLTRYRLPGIVGIILVGTAIGPDGLGVLEREPTISLLGEVGLVYLLFIAGLEINLDQFVRYKDRSIAFGLLSFLIPQVVGTVVGVYVLEFTVPAALLFASIFASHTLLAYPIVNRLGVATDEAITTTVGGTILTDTLALLVLAVVIASLGDGIGPQFWLQLIVGLALFGVAVWYLVPRLGRWFFRVHSDESYFEFLFVMVVLFGCAVGAELAGVEPIIGAFLAGLALNRLITKTGTLMNRIEFVGNALFIPFFLLSVGMLVDVAALLEGGETLVIGGTLVVLVLLTKYAAAWVTGRLYAYGRPEVTAMFGLSVGQAAAALAIVQIGFDAGVPGFNEHLINGVVLMILLVSFVSPTLVERAGRALVRTRTHRYDPTAQPQRILVPISTTTEYERSLLEVASAIREPASGSPIHTVSVVRPGPRTETEAILAALEEMRVELDEYAASAELRVEHHTRINHNVASGIARSTLENRITTLVIGWDGARARTQHAFGHSIDQVLRRTTQLALVARVREPLNTTGRIVLICPPGIEYNDGFDEALHTIALLAGRTGAPIHGIAVDGEPDRFDRRLEGVGAEAVGAFTRVPDWETLFETLEAEGGPTDVIVCVSARRGDVGWRSTLQTVPNRIATTTDGNFLIVYPPSEALADDRQFLRVR